MGQSQGLLSQGLTANSTLHFCLWSWRGPPFFLSPAAPGAEPPVSRFKDGWVAKAIDLTPLSLSLANKGVGGAVEGS